MKMRQLRRHRDSALMCISKSNEGLSTSMPRDFNAASRLGKTVLAMPMDASMQDWFNQQPLQLQSGAAEACNAVSQPFR